MSAQRIDVIAAHLDATLQVAQVPDYPNALNGLQLSHRGPVTRVAAAVDVSLRTIDGAIADGANLLIVHHGMFWSGAQRIHGPLYARLSRLMEHDVAVYSAHLPLDVHDTFGNSRLLAHELSLDVTGAFAKHQHVYCGVRGNAAIATAELHERLRGFSRTHGGDVLCTPYDAGRITNNWAICSGSGANADTLREAASLGVDTLIVGEGPHWTAVDATDSGLVVMYGGHYATETLGVQALAAHLAEQFGLPWKFMPAPTGL
jgi:dinuclear metal center YbgI/SA1388 family protein